MDYINEICPVCKRQFGSDDDIVVCPDCGTPHHRDCWNIKKACENSALHGEGFEWKPMAVKNQPAENPSVVAETKSTSEGGTFAALPRMTMAESEEDIENLLLRGLGYQKDETVDGISVGDAALYIQQGARGYIRKFKTKKFSFNWAAFFFSPAWFFYRKLYKAGAIILAVFVALALFTYPMIEKLDEQTAALESKITQIVGDEKNFSSSVLAQNEDLLNESKALLKGYALYFLINMLAPGLVSALIANELYKKKMIRDIKDIKEDSKDEDTQFEKALIMQKGGVSLMWGAVVLFASSYLPELLLQAGNFFSNII